MLANLLLEEFIKENIFNFIITGKHDPDGLVISTKRLLTWVFAML